jgi:hypothetical protein
MTDARSDPALLTTALVGALLSPNAPEGHMPRGCLDSWVGVGHILDAMKAGGYHVELCHSVFGWRTAVHGEVMQHSFTAPRLLRAVLVSAAPATAPATSQHAGA